MKICATGVNVAILIGAAAAAIKFGLFNVLGHRWRSELSCAHYALPDSSVIFTADYTIFNTGHRPMRLKEVRIRLVGMKQVDELLMPDEGQQYAKRIMEYDDPTLKNFFKIKPGERTAFTLRAKLPNLADAVFVVCDFSIAHTRRKPSEYRGFYVQHKQVNLVFLFTHATLLSDPGRPSATSPLRLLCVGFWIFDSIAVCFAGLDEAVSM